MQTTPDWMEHAGTLLVGAGSLIVVMVGVIVSLLLYQFKQTKMAPDCALDQARCAQDREKDKAEIVNAVKREAASEMERQLKGEVSTNQRLTDLVEKIQTDREGRWRRLEKILHRICAGQTILADRAGMDAEEFDKLVATRVRMYSFEEVTEK